MKHIFTSVFLFLSIITLNSCGDDGVVKPATTGTPAATADPNKGCFLKSFKYDSEDYMSISYNSKNQVDKISLIGIFTDVEATFSYNTDGSVSKISYDGLNYEFVYDKTVLTKINEKEDGILVGERVVISTAGKVASIAYFEVEGTKKTLLYTHKFTFTKEGNLSKYIFNVNKVDVDFLSDAVYDTKLNAFSKFNKASEAFLYALTDEFLFLPSETISNFVSPNNCISGKFRPNIQFFIISTEDPSTITVAGLNKEAPMVPFTNVSVLNKDNYPTKTTFKFKDPDNGDTSYLSELFYDCK
jgi:hypothetical protein